MAKLITSGIFALTIMMDPIKSALDKTYNSIYSTIYSRLYIDIKQDPRCAFAVREEINKIKNNNSKVVSDGSIDPNFNVADGKYSILYKNKYINLYIKDGKIEINSFMENINHLQSFMEEIYKNHCSPEQVIVFYTSKDNDWSFPIFRRPRNIANLTLTNEMNEILRDVDNFCSPTTEKSYASKGIPYRRGYFYHGKPGTGKSTLIEVIGIKHKMSVYMITLNALNMTDAVLINLVSSAQIRSIIIFEEIEKQLENVKKDTNSKISEGGLLTALDGPQRISHGSIIILTGNSTNGMSDSLKESLFRQGRIDKQYELTNKFT
jgi:hypothetical protein